MAVSSAYIANPANIPFVTGKTSRIGSSSTMMIVALIFFAIAVGLGGYTGYQFWRHQQLVDGGKIASGRITAGHSYTGDSNTYYLSYQYVVNGQSYTTEQQVSGSYYDSVYIGNRIDIRYLQSDPSQSEIDGQGINLTDRGGQYIAFIVFAGMALVAAILTLVVDGRNRRFSYNGQFITGRVIEAKARRNRSRYYLIIKYTFLTPTGIQREKKETVMRTYRGLVVPPPGTPIVVRYVSDRAFKLM